MSPSRQDANTQDSLFEECFTALEILLEGWHGARSSAGEIRDVDGQHLSEALLATLIGRLFVAIATARGLPPKAEWQLTPELEFGVPEFDGEIAEAVHERLMAAVRAVGSDGVQVETLGDVYETLMGYAAVRRVGPAICVRTQGPCKIWLDVDELLARGPAERLGWLRRELGLSKALAERVVTVTATAAGRDEVVAALETVRLTSIPVLPPGSWTLHPGDARRRTGAHYTPASLTAPMVVRTLAPLLARMGPSPSSAQLLALKICDPAMGSGAFLLAAARHLSELVGDAWQREGHGGRRSELVARARSVVCRRCLYGVDKNPVAVRVAKWSLWLLAGDRDQPLSFVDHGLRHGDALVGVSPAQLAAFRWRTGSRPRSDRGQAEAVVTATLERAAGLRRTLQRSVRAHPGLGQPREGLQEAQRLLEPWRAWGDLLVGVFFAESGARARDQRRADLSTRFEAWLGSEAGLADDLLELRAAGRRAVPALHWQLEFPEVFAVDPDDPASAAGFDAFIGNPPFLGGRNTSETLGAGYTQWLVMQHGGGASADLAGHFFWRCHGLLAPHGCIGLVATNTISQGDTRAIALQRMVSQEGYRIYDAAKDQPWPGAGTTVTVSIVHMTRDAQVSSRYNSRLFAAHERPDPKPLAANAGLSFQGSIVLGTGFVLTPQHRELLLAKDPRNDARIFPFLGGEEVNHNPDHGFDRFVIDFGEMSETEARAWPDLWERLHQTVWPQRRSKDARKYPRMVREWWKFWNARQGLYQSIRDLPRCLVTAAISKHLMFSFQPTDRVFSHKLFVFPLPSYAHFAILQSRCHEVWVRLLSSTLGVGLNYSPSDCFENFPFPAAPRHVDPALEAVGRRLYEARAAYLRRSGRGLTEVYNQLKDGGCVEREVVRLRELHEAADAAVLTSYGWSDIEVPGYGEPVEGAEREVLQRFRDRVIDRLFARNEELWLGGRDGVGHVIVGHGAEAAATGTLGPARRRS